MFRKLHPTVNFMDHYNLSKSLKCCFQPQASLKSIYKVGGGDNFLCIYAFSTQIHVYAVGTVLARFLGGPSKNYFKKFIVVNDLAFYSASQMKYIYIYILT